MRDSIIQQSPTGAQITALSKTKWREAMNKAFGMLTSASLNSADFHFRSQSLGDQEALNRGLGKSGN